jgi:hypothetical protein
VGLERAFNDHPAELVAWIQKAAPSQGVQRLQWTHVWPVIAGKSPTDGACTAISTVAAEDTAEELVFLAESLAQCENLALDQPNIVTEIIGALSCHPDTTGTADRPAISGLGYPEQSGADRWYATVGHGVRDHRRGPGSADHRHAAHRSRTRPAHAQRPARQWCLGRPSPARIYGVRRAWGMTMAPGAQKVALVAHAGCSVGWLGAVVTSLVLGVAGLASPDGQMVWAAYLALEVIGWYALVPLSLASLLTGLLQSLGTAWGLLRHYWVVAKLLMNLVATGVLLLYMQTLTSLADLARTAVSASDLARLRDPSPVVHAGAAVALLLVALVFSIYKPRGLTAYGQRRQHQRGTATATAPTRQAVSRR